MKLKYLFSAEFENGLVYEQNAQDISLRNPRKSCFFDVLEIEKETKLIKFSLKNKKNIFSVNLHNGTFQVNGLPFSIETNQEPSLERKPKYRIIFFRRHTHSFSQTGAEIFHEVEYVLGWQTTMNGKNFKKMLRIK